MAQRITLEVKVGVLVLSGIFILVFSIFAIGDLATYLQPGYSIHVQFDTANGITAGSPVQYAGIEVGKVQRVTFSYPSEQTSPIVELYIRVPSTVVVREDDIASISTFGLLGEKYLGIAPGLGLGPVIKKGGVLIGKRPVSTERIIERSDDVLTELQRALEGINSLVGDEEARLTIKEAIQEARNATRHWRALGERLNMAMLHAESGEGNIGKFLFDDDLYQRMVFLVEDLREHPWKLLARPRRKKSKD